MRECEFGKLQADIANALGKSNKAMSDDWCAAGELTVITPRVEVFPTLSGKEYALCGNCLELWTH